MQSRGFWCDCMRSDAELPAQGWKIHLSATPAHATGILMTVARILFAQNVPFKFVVDRTLLMVANGKRWHRGSAGKFITVYPRDTAQCGELLETLHQATIGYWGPYILSDRRYANSRIVHYRYGGLLPIKRLDVTGRSTHVIQDADGSYVEDERNAYFHLPPGIEDPFERFSPPTQDDAEPGTLKSGRYRIDKMLAISNSGGVYLAFDSANSRNVVIKEARPYTNVSVRGLDAIQLLKKEHRLLGVLSGAGIAPEPYDFFFDWEHAYLVEEYLEGGVTIRESMTAMSLLLRTRPTQEDSRIFYRRYRAMFSKLAEIVGILHDRHIVFSDLSMANVIVFEQDGDMVDMKLIDFEGAYERDVDLPTHLFTPGFSSEEAIEKGMADKPDDYYAIGGLLMSGLFPMNSLLSLNRSAHEAYLKACETDFDFPPEISQVIRDLLDADPKRRPEPGRVVDVLSKQHDPRPPHIGTGQLDAVDVDDVVERTIAYCDSVADYGREDRLYPADPMVFDSNPLSIAHGACGIAYVGHRVRGRVEPRALEWILSRRIDASLPSGLYIGLSGIAWSLLEMGLEEKAREAISATENHPLLWRSADVFNGAAGWGMAQLRFFMATGDQAYLDRAREAGRFLIDTREIATTAKGRSFWTVPEGVSASFGHGASGVALFLLYLYLATKDESFLEVGREGIEWAISKGFPNPNGGMSWFARDTTPSYTPYWRWGSSGIGRTVLRYWHVTGEPRFRDLMEEIHLDCDHKYTIFPGYFFGTAGICEMYMDMARFSRWETMALQTTRKLLSGCLLFPVERPGGLAFPGESLSRISCDFGTGGAGIALVMHRYRNRCGASFMLDDLIPEWPRADQPLG